MRSLGYPRRRKNGGHSEAGAQPCRFTARRATNGVPPPRRRSRRLRFFLRGGTPSRASRRWGTPASGKCVLRFLHRGGKVTDDPLAEGVGVQVRNPPVPRV